MHLDNLKWSRTLASFALTLLILAVAGVHAQTYTDLHDLNPAGGDPANLYATGLIPQGWNGNLYGVSLGGGTSGLGTVYSITLGGTPTVLDSFDRTNGADAYYGLTLGNDGNFYGVTTQGGSSNDGTVFKMTPAGTLTVLYSFTGGADGAGPFAPPVQGTDGNFYGVTTGIIANAQTDPSTFYKITPTGTFKTMHTLTTAQGTQCVHTILGSDGNFYASCNFGGANNNGTLFRISAAGSLTLLHNMTAATDGTLPTWAIQGTDGNFYGAMGQAGPHNAGTIYKLTSTGTYKVLYSPTGGADGGNPLSPTQGPDGNLYGPALAGGNTTACSGGCGVIYKITTAGAYSVLYTFDSTHGANPESMLTLDTDGLLYGNTQAGGAHSDGVFYSFNLGFKPFVTLGITSGKVGTKVGIMGQGFSSSSVVKFGGVPATTITLAGTTYVTATVPAGAIDGYVTVTTGSTTLTSTKTFIVHDSWSSGAAMPTAAENSATGVLAGKIYVVGGYTTAPTADVQIYNPATNTWSTGPSLPTATSAPAAAVVNNVLYVFGGRTGVFTNAVWAYNPTTKTWSGKAAMPTARNGAVAVVEKGIIYVAGGYNGTDFLATVESYNPATNTWKEEAPMLGTKDFPAAGLIGTTIVVADGSNVAGSVTGDTEGYNATTNTWTSLAADSTAREGTCSAVIGTLLYDAGGYINNGGAATAVNESFSLSANKWTSTLAAMPQGVMFPGSAVYNGQLYCFGGEATWLANPVNNVQIYQP